MEPFHLGNYRVVRELGKGGMGVVYLAEDLLLDRLVAIKVLHPHLAQNPEFRERFLMEARNQAKLVHPNITTLYSYEEEDGRIFLVMEYIEGETLELRLHRLGRLSPEEIKDIFRQVLAGVAYAHAKGVIHRDLKPGNIAITPGQQVKIMDFGIAVQAEAEGEAKSLGIFGTSYYMAPEQIKGEGVCPGTDIYALGVTLYEMITGHPPFDGPTDHAIRAAHLLKPPPAPRTHGCPTITSELEEVILKALEKDPKNRFTDAGELLEALETALIAESKAAPAALRSPGASSPSISGFSFSWLSSASIALTMVTGGLLLLGGAYLLRPVMFQNARPVSTIGPPAAVTLSPPSRPPGTLAVSPSPPPRAASPFSPEEPAKSPSPAELIHSLNTAFSARGLNHVKVTATERMIMITGVVQSSKDKKAVIEVAKSHCPAELLDFAGLKVRLSVSKAIQTQRAPREEQTETKVEAPPVQKVEAAPNPPPSPPAPENVRFKFGSPTVTKIR